MTFSDEEALAQRDRLKAVVEDFKRRVFVARSKDGLVKVRVLGTGQIVGLELDPRIYREHDAQKLASTILTTLNKASAAAARAHIQRLEEATGNTAGSFQELMDNASNLAERLFDEAEGIRRGL